MGSQRVGRDWVTELNWTELDNSEYVACIDDDDNQSYEAYYMSIHFISSLYLLDNSHKTPMKWVWLLIQFWDEEI